MATSTGSVAAHLRQGFGGQARFDVDKVRADFPILTERVHGQPLVYLDSANTSQKPEAVLRVWTTTTATPTPIFIARRTC